MRKPYTKPAVETEQYLEQTSLACNLTESPPYGFGGECGQISMDDYRKGGAWMNGWEECSEAMFSGEGGCGPLIEGGAALLAELNGIAHGAGQLYS